MKARLSEIIERVNELFEGDLTDDDMLIYVNDTIVGKLLENETLQEQAANNEPARFGESPDLLDAVVEAVLSARIAHQKMSDQVLNDPKVLRGLIDVLVNFTDLHARLRAARKAG
jgi:type I restriction enzyme R subunit